MKAGYAYFQDPETGNPCQKPPWGELVAVNVNTGDDRVAQVARQE